MLKNIFVFVVTLAFLKVSANFNFKLKYCSLKCGCEPDSVEPNKESQEPKGYYWRDFYGSIPSDAYPLGNKNQYPQTFIGKVFDPSHNGTFLTTIVEGLEYVYNAYNGTVTKKTEIIQIMCTKEPERLLWKKLTKDTVGSYPDYSFVQAGAHRVKSEKGIIARTVFVVKISKCKIHYVGSTTTLDDPVEYAATDGTLQNTTEKMFLLYKKENEEKEKSGGKPFISHTYEYRVRAGSIIPYFYKQLNIGSCTIICTNAGLGKKKDEKKDARSISAMEYYWQPTEIFDANVALKAGVTYSEKTVYIGQAYSISFNWYDVGQTEGSYVAVSTFNYVLLENMDSHIFSTNHPEKFEWVNTTYENFASLDKSRMIPGGKMDNGTKIYVGRILKNEAISPASVRVYESGLYYAFSYYGESANIQLLMLKKSN